ncbi:hypothetical protein Lal_00048607 [Lupinus albus]|nr:hypothetical protein Lal_00048607 [Lupinus albus]
MNTLEKKNGSYILIDCLLQNGTEHIFGYPGGAILPIYDELYYWEKLKLVKHILVRHEQCAAHAADAYSRSSKKVGVCFATSGPGATNLVTGIATAKMDSIPLIIITGQVTRNFLGTDAFQETDIFGITLPIVKHSYVIRDLNLLPDIISEAFFLAKNGRPESYQPLLYIGGGVIRSYSINLLGNFAKIFQLPLTSTLMGKGSYNELDHLSLGMLGMHGTASANFAISECDLLIAIGTRFDDRVTGKLEEFAVEAEVVHVDIDPAEISKNRCPQLTKTQRDAVFTTDVGQHQMWSAQLLNSRPNQWVSSSGLGTMGFGVPAAIGSKIINPSKQIICITGDSSSVSRLIPFSNPAAAALARPECHQ